MERGTPVYLSIDDLVDPRRAADLVGDDEQRLAGRAVLFLDDDDAFGPEVLGRATKVGGRLAPIDAAMPNTRVFT